MQHSQNSPASALNKSQQAMAMMAALLPWHTDLVLDILVTQLQLHDTLKRSEECFIKVKMRWLIPVGENLRQYIMDEGNCLLRHMSFLMAGSLQNSESQTPSGLQATKNLVSEGLPNTPYRREVEAAILLK